MPSPRLGQSWPGLPGVLAAPPAARHTQQQRAAAPAGVDRRAQSAFAPRRASGEPLAESRVSLAALLGGPPEAVRQLSWVVNACCAGACRSDALLAAV